MKNIFKNQRGIKKKPYDNMENLENMSKLKKDIDIVIKKKIFNEW